MSAQGTNAAAFDRGISRGGESLPIVDDVSEGQTGFLAI
jgi:hypothetical protein